jgi:hypothetical protein
MTGIEYKSLDPRRSTRVARPASLDPRRWTRVAGPALSSGSQACAVRTGRSSSPGPHPRGGCYISRASYTSTVPPPASTGQPLAFADASVSESAVTIE